MRGFLLMPVALQTRTGRMTVPERTATESIQAEPLAHEVHGTFESLKDIGREWDAFVEEQDGDLYSSFDWCRIWWKHYGGGRQLFVHLFRAGGRLVGIVPIFGERWSLGPFALRLARLVGSDHTTTTCGLVVAAGHRPAVVEILLNWLGRKPAFDLLQWGPLAGYFSQRPSWVDLCGRSGQWRVQSSAHDGPHILFDLPRSFSQYLAGLSKKERSNIKLARRRFFEDPKARESWVPADQVEQWMPAFIEQHQKQWTAEGLLGHFGDWPRAESFHRELARASAQKGDLWLVRAEVGGAPVGFQYSYRFGRRLHWLLGSRDLDSRWDSVGPGRVLFCASVERAIRQGVVQIDGLKGMYDYKLRLGGTVRELQSIRLIRNQLLARMKVRLARLYSYLLNLVYYRIWFTRIAPRLPLHRRRGLWRAWIRSRI